MFTPTDHSADGPDRPRPANEWVSIGARIRDARSAAGMSVRELARRVKVSPSHVSQVERGNGSFSATVLYAVAAELGLSLDQLFDPYGASAADRWQADPEHASKLVLRRADRPSIKLKDGPRWERLTPQAEDGAEFLEVVYSPRNAETNDSGLVRHQGREYGVVLSGAISVQIGFESMILEAGDSIAFDSMTPHRFQNAVDVESRAVWFVRESPDPYQCFGGDPSLGR
jgi:transcriptional regulator with XRE-family HTH domain